MRSAAVLAVALFLAGCGSNTPPGPGTASPPSPGAASATPAATGSSTPAASPGSAWAIDDSARASADPGLVTALAAERLAPDTAAAFEVTGVRGSGDWAVVSAVASAAPGAAVAPTETLVAIARRTSSGWTLTTDRDPGFCAALATLPAGAVTDAERTYFGGCN